MRRLIVFFAILLLGPFPSSVLAAPGGLDYSFDADGYVVTSLSAGIFDGDYAVALQSDGKIIAVGVASGDFALARYNTNGSLDTSFDSDGKLTTDFGASDSAWAVAIQTDGKIVVAGDSFGLIQRFALARYNTNGSLDTTFDSDGLVTTGFDDLASAAAMVIQTDGKIVLGGLSLSNTTNQVDFALARYNTNGSLDTSFDTDGKVTTAFADQGIAWTMALQTDGKIVLAGQTFPSSGAPDFALARYNTNGSLDTSFDTDGKVTTDFNNNANVVNKVLIQTDGKIVAAGDGTVQGDTGLVPSSDFALARYNTNGSLDTSFDSDGKVTTDFNGLGDAAYGAALQSDGKIIAVGVTIVSATDYNFAAARYNTSGSLDPAVDNDGKVTTAISGFDSVALAVIIQTDGQIVIAGILNDGTKNYFGVARINASLLENNQQTVGSGGTVTTDVESDGAIPLDPVETTITSPNGGTVTISESTATTPTPTGISFLGQQVTITAPAATAASPLVIVFTIDSSIVSGSINSLKVYKNGVQVGKCTGAAGAASPDPCVSNRTVLANGDWQITVLSSTASGWNFSINNLPQLVINEPADAQLYSAGSSVSVLASFTDDDVADVHTCNIDWDDGTNSSGVVSEADGSGTCNALHTFSSAGVYTIKATVNDDFEGSDIKTVMAVVYDPSAGFVTGGGWINSPAGAYTKDPSLAGKAIFGFVSRYQKGATVPIGQTEFQFKAGEFNFHSDTYQWLVVAGAKAQYKGTGSVNGEGSYNFILTATDGDLLGGGQSDRFRIKITKDSSIVYDNVLGASDDIDSTNPQQIGGGSIVIHK